MRAILFSIFFIASLTVVILTFLGCSDKHPSDPELASIDTSNLTEPDLSINIPGLSSCTTASDYTIQLNSKTPVTIIVHGCEGSAARFRALAQVFAFHGQQSICFNYNDRDSLEVISSQLVRAVEILAENINTKQITIIGHSLGGLITRSTFKKNRIPVFDSPGVSIRLVTISSPFAGIKAANHCGSRIMQVLTLGLAIPVCQLISGDKWYEITSASQFIKQPGLFVTHVQSHLKIVTDEKNTCRTYRGATCIEDDYVFSLSEQYSSAVDASSNLKNIEIAAGHVEIVGDYRIPPEKLISLLQNNGIMNQTRPYEKEALTRLLSALY